MTALDELVAMLPPPPGVHRDYDWTSTEERLGVRIPDDFKELTAVYGDSLFCDAIRLFRPSEFPYIDLVDKTMQFREFFSMEGLGETPDAPPEGVVIDASTLISWGESPGGDHYLWDVHDPEKWTLIFADADQLEWGFYEGSVAGFLVDWMLKRRGVDPGFTLDEYIGDGAPYVDFFDPADPTVNAINRVVMR